MFDVFLGNGFKRLDDTDDMFIFDINLEVRTCCQDVRCKTKALLTHHDRMRLVKSDNTVINGSQSANNLITTKDLDCDDVGNRIWSFNKHVYSPNDL